jgi:hypothetical protein
MKKIQESGSFLKKRTKKLLLIWTVLVSPPGGQFSKSFLVTFFQKSNRFLPSLPLGPIQ